MPELENQEEKFVVVRCKMCQKFLCEVSEESVGTLRQKCTRCKRIAKIRLPLILKPNNITPNAQAA